MLPSVIVVDDSLDDRYLAQRVIRRACVAERIVEIEDGDELLPLLEDAERFRNECGEPPPPVLILLDINMPRRSGFEVLADLAERFASGGADPRRFVIMMFTSSQNAADRQRSLHWPFVKEYLVKPIRSDAFRAVIERHYPKLRPAA